MSFSPPRRVRLCYYNQWAAELESARDYCAKVPSLDLRGKVANPSDASLMRKARLDCDWYAANTHCFAESGDPLGGFLPAWVVGTQHLIGLAAAPREPGEERWLITMGQQPQYLGQLAGKVFEFGNKRIREHFEDINGFLRNKKLENLREIERTKK